MKTRNSKLEEENEETEYEDISVVNNNIYFYKDISYESIKELCTILKKMECEMISIKHKYNLSEDPKIYLYIQSYGGDAYAGLSAMNTIKNCKIPVVTIVDGYAASAATFLLLGGKEKWMRENSNVLIHQIRTEFWNSKYEEMKDEMRNCKMLMKSIVQIYKSKTKIPENKLENILQKELNLNCVKCMKYGIVDKII